MHRNWPRHLLKEAEGRPTNAGRPPEEFLGSAYRLRRLLRGMVLWSEDHPGASERERRRMRRAAHACPPRVAHVEGPGCRSYLEGAVVEGKMVFTFLRKPAVAWHDNVAENHVRQVRTLSKVRRCPSLLARVMGPRAIDVDLSHVPVPRNELRRSGPRCA